MLNVPPVRHAPPVQTGGTLSKTTVDLKVTMWNKPQHNCKRKNDLCRNFWDRCTPVTYEQCPMILHIFSWNFIFPPAFERFWENLRRFWEIFRRFWKIFRRFWEILRDSEKFWEILRNFERFWEILRNFEKFWEILTSPRQYYFSIAMVHFEKFWEILRNFERFWEILRKKNRRGKVVFVEEK